MVAQLVEHSLCYAEAVHSIPAYGTQMIFSQLQFSTPLPRKTILPKCGHIKPFEAAKLQWWYDCNFWLCLKPHHSAAYLPRSLKCLCTELPFPGATFQCGQLEHTRDTNNSGHTHLKEWLFINCTLCTANGAKISEHAQPRMLSYCVLRYRINRIISRVGI